MYHGTPPLKYDDKLAKKLQELMDAATTFSGTVAIPTAN
jgi:hypothetical protein